MKVLLPLCSNPRAVTRDGWAGDNARLNIPFFGFWFADGRQIGIDNTFGNVAQYPGYTLNGRIKPDVFEKYCNRCADGL